MQPDRTHHLDVQDAVGHLEAGSPVDWCGHATLRSACQEGWVDVVREGHGYHVAEASAQSDEVEGDGSVVVAEHKDHVRGLVWGGMCVRWQVELQTLLLLVQPKACLGVHWLSMEAHAKEEVHSEEEGQAGGGKVLVVVVYKVQVAADGHGVQEGAVDCEVQGRVEVLGQQGQMSP